MTEEPTAAAPAFKAERAALVAGAATADAKLRQALTELTDRWLAGLAEQAAGSDGLGGVALVALGGYGRREPTPGSDLDLLLVHRGDRDEAALSRLADGLWYPIWDAGVPLDHSVRTVEEALATAAGDLKAALGLLDARHVAGEADLTAELRTQVLGIWRSTANQRLPELIEATRERWERAGEVAFLLEPDLKEGRGGLRDVTLVRAVAAAWVVEAPAQGLRDAAATLLDARGALHRRTGRAPDRLLLQEQDGVAADLGYADADALLRTVSSAARVIAFAADETLRRVERWLPRKRPLLRGRQADRVPLADGVIAQEGEVVLARDADPAGDPTLLLRVAAAAASAGLPIARTTLARLVAESPALGEPWPPAAREAFLRLLGAGRGLIPVVESLDQSGVLAGLLPDWEHVRSRPQRNPVHRYTVDRHLVECVVEAAELAREVDRPDLLLLGALLHDIGKGRPGDHSEAGVEAVRRIAPRLGLPDADADILATLVRHHLLLADTATRRDLDDPATAAAVASAVGGSRRVLDLLHRLTQADGRATGPAAWTPWKASLVDDLVRRTAATLAGEPVSEGPALDPDQRALAERGRLDLAVAEGDGGVLTVTVAAPDRPGMLWRAAGVLALHRLDVRAATATSVGPTAVTVFSVEPRFGSTPDWSAVRADLRAAVAGTLPLEERLASREAHYAPAGPVPRPRVDVLDDVSELATVVEVRAHDSAGLLHRIGRALESCGLDVRSARVSTFGAEAVDVFYVLDAAGGKLASPPAREEVAAAVLAALRR